MAVNYTRDSSFFSRKKKSFGIQTHDTLLSRSALHTKFGRFQVYLLSSFEFNVCWAASVAQLEFSPTLHECQSARVLWAQIPLRETLFLLWKSELSYVQLSCWLCHLPLDNMVVL